MRIQAGSGGVVVARGHAKASEPIARALADQPGTRHYVGESNEQASVAGLPSRSR
ncbi:MAG TPA: hypothetical protein VMA73_17350 [Streptosporangiaceae bacterium]|nr:hypothetical protein [Streptosporangiaceae bacterium]